VGVLQLSSLHGGELEAIRVQEAGGLGAELFQGLEEGSAFEDLVL